MTYLRRFIGYHAGHQVGAQRVYLDLGVIAFVRPQHSVLVDPALTQVEIARVDLMTPVYPGPRR